MSAPAPEYERAMAVGHAALRGGRHDDALAAFRVALEAAPGDRDARYWQANAARMAGEGDEAARLFESLVEERPGDEEAAFGFAFFLREAGRPARAEAVLLALADRAGSDLVLLKRIAGFLREADRFEAAAVLCERALARAPEDAGLHLLLARLRQATGDFEGGRAACRAALDRDPSLAGAWLRLAHGRRFERADDPDLERLEAASDPARADEAQMAIAFALGKAYDDLGRWRDAFRDFERGNRMAHAQAPWDRAAWRRFVESAVATDLTEEVAAGPAPLFIVGMLRSGTTLLEQRLDRHPGITARGELNFLARVAERLPDLASRPASLRAEWADALWRQLRRDGPAGQVYIDKNPLNFRFLPQLFTLFPAARVVHVVRDGRDSGLSCWTQLFAHADAAFANDLDDIVEYYAGYRRLMERWAPQAGGRLHTVRYERLVAEPEPVLRGVLEFLGLEWDARLLETSTQPRAVRTASAWQARQPLYTRSVARWRHYAPFLDGFFERIEAIDAGEAGGT